MKKTAQEGFTLIELIMVIMIIGVLALSALPAFRNLRLAAQVAVVRGSLGALRGLVQIQTARAYVFQNAAPANVFVNICPPQASAYTATAGPASGGPGWTPGSRCELVITGNYIGNNIPGNM